MIKIILSEDVCLCACVNCFAYDPKVLNSYICFSMSVCLKITFEAVKCENMICVQPFERHLVSCVCYNFVFVLLVCLHTWYNAIYKFGCTNFE
jgi:hypothetical protein